MADVKITFEEVKTKANEIHTCNVNLDQALKDIKPILQALMHSGHQMLLIQSEEKSTECSQSSRLIMTLLSRMSNS